MDLGSAQRSNNLVLKRVVSCQRENIDTILSEDFSDCFEPAKPSTLNPHLNPQLSPLTPQSNGTPNWSSLALFSCLECAARTPESALFGPGKEEMLYLPLDNNDRPILLYRSALHDPKRLDPARSEQEEGFDTLR
eukprot:1795837-Rhodomonas_salina.1